MIQLAGAGPVECFDDFLEYLVMIGFADGRHEFR